MCPADQSDNTVMAYQNPWMHVFLCLHQLDSLDRQVILLYLEGLDAASIGDITGISAGNVATKVHRVNHVWSKKRDSRPLTGDTIFEIGSVTKSSRRIDKSRTVEFQARSSVPASIRRDSSSLGGLRT